MENNDQLLKVTEVTVEVSGSGKDKKEAIADIFKKLHRNVYTQIEFPIIQMETQEVYFDSVREIKEKQLLAKTLIKIEARIVLKIKYLEI